MAQVRYKVDISRVLKRLAEVKKVGADGIRELTLEYAKRAASKAIRTTPPNSLKNGGNEMPIHRDEPQSAHSDSAE